MPTVAIKKPNRKTEVVNTVPNRTVENVQFMTEVAYRLPIHRNIPLMLAQTRARKRYPSSAMSLARFRALSQPVRPAPLPDLHSIVD